MLAQQLGDLGVGGLDDPPDLLVDQPLGRLGGLATRRAAAVPSRPPGAPRSARSPGSCPSGRPCARAIRVSCWMSDSAPVVRSPNTISSAARPPSATLICAEQVALVEVEAVGVGRREGDAERLAAGDDRDLADRVGARREHPDDRVAGLVVGGAAPVLLGEHHLALGAEHDPLQRVGEVLARRPCSWPRGGQQRGLVDEVGQVGADHPGRRGGDRAEVDVGRPSGTERVWTRRIASRPARSGGWTATRRSKRPGRSSAGSRISGRLVAPSTITPVRGSKPSISVRIWLSVCSRSSWPPEMLAPPAGPRAADGVELVDEDDRGGRLLGLGEQVPHAGGADADDHLDELRGRHLEEGDAGLAGHRSREQRLAGAGEPAEQHAARDPAAQLRGTCRGS